MKLVTTQVRTIPFAFRFHFIVLLILRAFYKFNFSIQFLKLERCVKIRNGNGPSRTLRSENHSAKENSVEFTSPEKSRLSNFSLFSFCSFSLSHASNFDIAVTVRVLHSGSCVAILDNAVPITVALLFCCGSLFETLTLATNVYM